MRTPEIPSITQAELAQRWGLTQRSIQNRHRFGKPMPPIAEYLGMKPIRYRLADVEAFETSQGETKQ